MITLTRNQVRRLRAVFRRSTLGINHRGVVSELVFRVEGGQLRAQHRYCDLAVEHAEPAGHRTAAIIAVPLDALADFEGAADTPVTHLLIKARPVFGCRSLPREGPVEVGRTDMHVFFRAGSWTIAFAIQREARFPTVERAIPEPAEVATRLRLDPEDAGFLETALGRLPGAGDINAPVTIELLCARPHNSTAAGK